MKRAVVTSSLVNFSRGWQGSGMAKNHAVKLVGPKSRKRGGEIDDENSQWWREVQWREDRPWWREIGVRRSTASLEIALAGMAHRLVAFVVFCAQSG
jgi:hypothetical protein